MLLRNTNLDFTKEERNVMFVFLIIIIAIASLGNLWILVIISKTKEMRTPYYILLANLVFTDAAISIIDMPLTLIALVSNKWQLGNWLCNFHAFTVAAFFCMNILTITAMTVEKYFSLVHPLDRSVTPTRCKRVVLFIWVFSLIFGGFPLVGWGNYRYNRSTFTCGVAYPITKLEKLFYLIMLLFLNIVPVLTMLITYFKIYRSFKDHSRRIRNFSRENSACLSVLKLQRHLIALNCFTLTIFVCCWMPFFWFIFLAIVKDIYNLPHGLGASAYWVCYSASSWNAILYLTRNVKFKNETMKILDILFNQVICWFTN